MKDYLGRDEKRWDHWINRFKQKKALRHIVHIVPRERPKLHPSVYRGICDSFVSLSDCEGLAKAVRRFPPQLLDYDAFLRDVKTKMQKDPELQKNEDFIEALYHMFSYTSDKEGAFLTLLKLKNKKIFDVVRAGKIEVDMQRNIRELIDISPEKTIELFLERERANVRQSISAMVELLQEREVDHEYLHIFLHQLFLIDTNITCAHHALQPELYASYGRKEFLYFLKNTELYD